METTSSLLLTAAVLLGLFVVFGLAVVLVRALGRIGAPPAAPPPDVAPDVRRLVSELADPGSRDAAREELIRRADEVVPDLLACADLDDTVARAEILALLGDAADPRSLPALGSWAVRGDWDAARALAAHGSSDGLPVLLEILAAPGPPVRFDKPLPTPVAYAVYEGIVRAAELGRAGEAFRDALAAPLADRVGELVRSDVCAAEALVALDPDAATVVLSSPEVLGRGRCAVGDAFHALLDAGRAVPPEIAEATVSAIDLRELRGPDHATFVRNLLRMLARARPPSARRRIDEALAVDDPWVRNAGAHALVEFHGLVGFDERVLSERSAGDACPSARRTWRRVRALQEAPGLGAWFASEDADRPEDTLAALREIGAHDVAAVVEEACRLFGERVPADAAQRVRAVRTAEAQGRVPFLGFDETLAIQSVELETKALLHVVARADEFRAPS